MKLLKFRRCYYGKKSTPIKSLYTYTIEELKKMKNSHKSEFSRTVLTTIIMRTEGINTTEISKFVLKSVPTVVSYINKWNSIGIKALEDKCGIYSESTFTAEMLDDLIKTVTTTHPNDFGFLGNVWTTPLLSEYINQNYGIKYSNEYIRLKLKANNFSFKRAQRKPTKANKDSQEAFKKMSTILNTVENYSDYVLYAMDETLLRAESDNRRTWSLVDISPILEHNASHKGINIIGATEIAKNFDTIIDVYEAKHSITSVEIQSFIENLLKKYW